MYSSSSSDQKLLSTSIFGKSYNLFGVETDRNLIYQMCLIGTIYTIVVGIYSIVKPAPYGRYSGAGTPWYYGPQVNAKIGWMVQEMPAWVIPVILIYTTKCVHFDSVPNFVLTILFMVHYIQRSIIYPLKMTGRAKPTNSLVVLTAIVFCTFNGLLQGHHLLNVQRIEKSGFFYSGILLFAIGMAINIHHDGILINLKAKSGSDHRENHHQSEYKIPHGSLFTYVSGANYFGEMVEWWGFAVATGQYPQILFAIFSSLFLGIRAWHHHHFYLNNFKSTYPRNRKAVIPFLF